MRPIRSEPTLTEWVVLGLVAEQPTHGWALVGMLKPGGAIGEVWSSSRPVVYRAVRLLVDRGHIRAAGSAEGQGPERTVLAVSPAGSAALAAWLTEPVPHVRDIRSAFLVKLLLLDRRGLDTSALVRAQLALVRPIVRALQLEEATATGVARAIALWRSTAAGAAVQFLEALERETSAAHEADRASPADP